MPPGLFPPASLTNPPQVVTELMKAAPGVFSDAAAAKRFLQLIYFPASRHWRYQLNGKSGNTFTLNLLFELEFGGPFTCRLNDTDNQHPDFALFQLPAARLMENAIGAEDTIDAVLHFPGLSIATVRNPFSRAVSGFRYLCRSHEIGDRRFLSERIRLNALEGFDWDKDPHSPRGFNKFLDYLGRMAETEGPDKIDPHWLSQQLHIRPDLYKPDLIGRTENLAPFAKELAERLDHPLPDLSRLKSNRTKKVSGSLFLYDDPAAIRKVRSLYAEDFIIFGYDPDHPAY